MLDYELVERILKTLPSPKPLAKDIFKDAMLCQVLLFEAYGFCRNHGRHQYRSLADIKTFVEDFLGRTVDDQTVIVACRMNGLQPTQSVNDQSVLLVKTPPLGRFEEARDRWKQRQLVEEKEFDKRWSAFRAKHPASGSGKFV